MDGVNIKNSSLTVFGNNLNPTKSDSKIHLLPSREDLINQLSNLDFLNTG